MSAPFAAGFRMSLAQTPLQLLQSLSSHRLSRWTKTVEQIGALEPELLTAARQGTAQAQPLAEVSGQDGRAADQDSARGVRPGARSRPPHAEHAAFRRAALGRDRAAPSVDRRDANRRRQNAHRHAADVPQCLGRQGRAPGHGQRLPGPPRRRVDAAALRALGMSVGADSNRCVSPSGAQAYACDITYGTAKEFGFDFLRDRLLLRRIREGQSDFLEGMLGRGDPGGRQARAARAYFVLVDEADSILIDEARTPLIISALPSEDERLAVACYAGAPAWPRSLTRTSITNTTTRSQGRTDPGRPAKVRNLPKPAALDSIGMVDDLRVHRAGGQGRARVSSRPAVRSPRRRDRDRR